MRWKSEISLRCICIGTLFPEKAFSSLLYFNKYTENGYSLNPSVEIFPPFVGLVKGEMADSGYFSYPLRIMI